MKVKVKEKELKENYNMIWSVGYCDIQHIEKALNPQYYTAGVYGWNADHYEIIINKKNIYKRVLISTGYRPLNNKNVKDVSHEKIKKLDEKARKIFGTSGDFQQNCKKVNKLLEKFIIKEVLK